MNGVLLLRDCEHIVPNGVVCLLDREWIYIQFKAHSILSLLCTTFKHVSVLRDGEFLGPIMRCVSR